MEKARENPIYIPELTTHENAVIAHERPVSAYFTYNPLNETFIIEWGKISADGNAKLHSYLI